MPAPVTYLIRNAMCVALLSGLFAGIYGAGSGGQLKSSDEWRRTANGWERSGSLSSKTWIATNNPLAESSHRFTQQAARDGRRSDAHPAALALVQLVGSMLALAVFGPRGRRILQETPFSVLLARSFRASVFGS
jgi:hypothetical protein